VPDTKVGSANIRNGLLPMVGKIEEFQELVVLNAAYEVDELRKLLKRVVLDSDALSVGEDFVLLSSAKFTPEKIEVAQRVGLDLIMPIACMLPLKRFVRWAEERNLRGRVAEALLGHASAVAGVVGVPVGWIELIWPLVENEYARDYELLEEHCVTVSREPEACIRLSGGLVLPAHVPFAIAGDGAELFASQRIVCGSRSWSGGIIARCRTRAEPGIHHARASRIRDRPNMAVTCVSKRKHPQ
jgi:hypothetical protein